MLGEPTGHLLQQVGRVKAVIVRESDDVSRNALEPLVTCSRETPAVVAKVADWEVRLESLEDGHKAIILVLIHYYKFKVSISLSIKAFQEPINFLNPADGSQN
jgi:hypothetical protein